MNLLLIFCSGSTELCGQTFKFPAYTSIAAYSTQQADAFSFEANQAALASARHFAAGLYAERKFFPGPLHTYRAACAVITRAGNFGFIGTYFGLPEYAEASFGLAYARRMGTIDIGAQFNYYRLSLGPYGHAASVNVEGGFIVHFTSRLNGGMHVCNPTRSGPAHEEKLPLMLGAGFGYDLSPIFYIGAAFEKEQDVPVSVRVGFHYAFNKKLFLRAGISSSGSAFFFGLGFMMGTFRTDATVSLHPQLGTTPGLLFLYNDQKE
ncbi:MAG TPA: hypothetical protein VNR87_12405 [Flavisolibacter sp.]|nr:hypothetical protein [Flavisolibacter sp.]